jgi:hypothetical protein
VNGYPSRAEHFSCRRFNRQWRYLPKTTRLAKGGVLIVMRALVRRTVTVLAIYTIALHTVLWAAVAPFTAAPPVDPLTVVCHSEASAPADPAPHGPISPAHACDHCNLCSAAAVPLAPNMSVVGRIEPVRTLSILHPANASRRDDVAVDPKLARGPPAIA